MASKEKPILLTGIRASGEIHLGNYLGAMQTAIQRQNEFKTYLFVADLHGLTTNPSPEELQHSIRSIAAAWLAIGLDTQESVFWRQSDVPEVLELSYVLTCVTSMGLLERAHSYKDALAKAKSPKAGLFFYPILMASDILLYEADYVPVGKDQAQHLEMTRDMATFFNEIYSPILRLPQALISEDVAIVPGVDGRKMSKSYDNTIQIFADEKELKRQIMSIKTDSKALEEPKDAESNTIYQLYKFLASQQESQAMKQKLEAGGYGYGDAKKCLFAFILERFGPMRNEYRRWIADKAALDAELKRGALRAREKATKIIDRVRKAVGL